MALSAAEKTRFFADGYIVVRNLISQDELQTLRRDYEDLALGRVADFPEEYISVRDVEGRADFGLARTEGEMEAPMPQGSAHERRGTQVYPRGEEAFVAQRSEPVPDPLDAVMKMNVPSRCHPVFDAFVRDPKIVDVVEDLMGPDIKLYFDQVFAKPPYARANRYHQDSVFWGFFASNFQLTCQIMLDDATRENGCVRFIPGSQDFGLVDWEHLPYMLTEDVLAREVDVPLQAGDATFHHSMTLHCSGPNTTPHRRRGWSLHYVSADTRYIGTPEETERIKNIGCLVGPEPTNGWPLIRGREFPGCV